MASRAHLRIRSPSEEITLEPGQEALIGRGPECLLVIDRSVVSRQHARVAWQSDGWVFEDLASTGGTWLGTERVTRRLVGDRLEVRLGNSDVGPQLFLTAVAEDGSREQRQEQLTAVRKVAPTGERPRTSAAAEPTMLPEPSRVPNGVFTTSFAPAQRTRIGRGPDNDIVLDDLLVSRDHAELVELLGVIQLRDLGSRNGTFVNGQPVERAELNDRDLVSIGHALFLFVNGRLEVYHDTGEVRLDATRLTGTGDDGTRLFDDISFSLPERSLLAVVGPSGSGKSSLLNALAGLRPATTGSVLYGGRNLYDDYAELRNRIGFVPQEDVLHRELTVHSTLEFAGRLRFPSDVTSEEAGARIDELLEELGIAHRRDVRLHVLSGGERKRTNVVSELLTEPSLLFLDEPTSGLDPGISRVLMQKLRELADGGRTCVVVTHELANIDLCDQLLVLAPGGVPAYLGPPRAAAAHFDHDDLSDVFRDLSTRTEHDWRSHDQSRPEPMQATTTPAEGAAPARRNWWSQFATLSARNVAVLSADRRNAALLLLQAPVLGLLLLAALPSGELAPPRESEVRLVSVAGLVLFVIVLAVTWVGANNSTREIARELAILRRERAAGLSLSAYVASKAVVLASLTIVQSVVLVSLAIARQGGPRSASLLGWGRGELIVIVTLAALAAMALGLLISAVAGTPERASGLLPLVLVLQLLLSAGIILPEIVDKPVLREISIVSSAKWGVAGAASTADINQLQLFDDRLRDLRSVDAADPGPALEVLTRDASVEPLWKHTAGAWLISVGALVVLTLIPLVAAALVLRRYDPGR